MNIGSAFILMVEYFKFQFIELGRLFLIVLLIHQLIYWITGVSLLNELIKATKKELRR